MYGIEAIYLVFKGIIQPAILQLVGSYLWEMFSVRLFCLAWKFKRSLINQDVRIQSVRIMFKIVSEHLWPCLKHKKIVGICMMAAWCHISCGTICLTASYLFFSLPCCFSLIFKILMLFFIFHGEWWLVILLHYLKKNSASLFAVQRIIDIHWHFFTSTMSSSI